MSVETSPDHERPYMDAQALQDDRRSVVSCPIPRRPFGFFARYCWSPSALTRFFRGDITELSHRGHSTGQSPNRGHSLTIQAARVVWPGSMLEFWRKKFVGSIVCLSAFKRG